MDDEDKKLLRTWEEIARKLSTEQDSRRMSKLAEELNKVFERYFRKKRKSA